MPFFDVSPWELYAASCISVERADMTPAQILEKLRADFAAYCADDRREVKEKLKKILATKDKLNEAIMKTKRSVGYLDEELSDFDVYMLSRCLEPLKRMPMVSQVHFHFSCEGETLTHPWGEAHGHSNNMPPASSVRPADAHFQTSALPMRS